MKLYNVAVVGATGIVGRAMVKVLEERNFPVNKLVLLASNRSLGKEIDFHGKPIPVQTLSPDKFRQVEFALFSAGATISKEYGPIAAQTGAVVVDNSSAFRMEPDVPLVVPEVNRKQIFKHKGIIANPNCSTIQLVLILKPLHDRFVIKRVVVSTYQSVTGAGQAAVEQLRSELSNTPIEKKKLPHPIAFNCIPHIDLFLEDGYTKEEFKMMNETKKIMGENIKLTATTVRVPVLGGHSESVNIEFEKQFDLQEIFSILHHAPGVVVQDNPKENIYPMPILSQDRDEVFVGRIRRDETVPHGINLWIVSDNIRKGAATNAVQIAEALALGK